MPWESSEPSFPAQAGSHSLHFCFGSESPCIGLAQALPDMIDLPLVNVDIRSQRFVHNVRSVALQSCGYPVQIFPYAEFDAYRHRFSGHGYTVARANTTRYDQLRAKYRAAARSSSGLVIWGG